MRLTTGILDADKSKTQGLVLGIFEKEKLRGVTASVDRVLGGYISRAIKDKIFEGKKGQTLLVDSLGKHPAGKILITGLGEKKDVTQDIVRQAAAVSATALRDAGVKSFITALAQTPVKKSGADELAQAVAEGSILALYTFESLKTEKTKKKIEQITLIADSAEQEKSFARGLRKGKTLAESACFARDLINLPSNVVTPSYLADQARTIARRFKIKITVLDPNGIKKHKMGGLMAVSKGSMEPARFIALEWMKGPKSQKPIVLVGKGITFDTGGISLKPSASMEEMKADMSGGAAVLGAMRAAAALNLKVNLVGLVPATENMPGGAATKPGDVVTGLSKVTMEIINTDAEGRLILSDALAYAGRYKPECVVDIATLTGACMIALGSFASGLFGNDEDLINKVREAGEETGERCWPLPLWPDYEEQIKSDVADIKNVGPRWGGAITAAAFLKKHVEGKWAHIDIAGTAYNSNKARHYLPKGGIGIGVRQMIRLVEKIAKS